MNIYPPMAGRIIQNKPKQTQFMVSRVEPPVGLSNPPMVSELVLSNVEGVEPFRQF